MGDIASTCATCERVTKCGGRVGLSACGYFTSGERDDRFVDELLNRMVESGYLQADLTPYLAQASMLMGFPFPPGTTARIDITECDLDDSPEKDQVKLNYKEFRIDDIMLSGILTINEFEYSVSMTVSLLKANPMNTWQGKDIKLIVQNLVTDPELTEPLQNALMPLIGDAFSHPLTEQVEERKLELEEDGQLSGSEEDDGQSIGPRSRNILASHSSPSQLSGSCVRPRSQYQVQPQLAPGRNGSAIGFRPATVVAQGGAIRYP